MNRPWICLMYHDVTLARPQSSGGTERFAVSKDTLERQLDLISRTKLTGRCVAAMVENGPTESVGISFDDGTIGQYEHAFPALLERGISATFFVVTSWVGTPGFASWDQLREMQRAGMSIQSHTHAHRFLSELDPPEVLKELSTSKQILDEQLDQDTHCLALPGGDFPRRSLRHLLAAPGYRTVATSRWGVNRWPSNRSNRGLHIVRRCTIHDRVGAESFGKVLRADPPLAARRRLREATLHAIRSCLGPSRYQTWRRRLLDRIASLQ